MLFDFYFIFLLLLYQQTKEKKNMGGKDQCNLPIVETGHIDPPDVHAGKCHLLYYNLVNC